MRTCLSCTGKRMVSVLYSWMARVCSSNGFPTSICHDPPLGNTSKLVSTLAGPHSKVPVHSPDNGTSDPSAMRSVVTHQTCLVLWTWRKLADETNAKNTPKICWKIVLTWGIQTALAIHITQRQDYPYAKNEYKLVVAIYCTRMTANV